MLCPNACIPPVTNVVEPHHFDADPDVHADSDFIWCRSGPGSEFSPWCRLKLLKKCSNRLLFQTFWPVLCKWIGIQIRFQIQLFTLMRIQMRIWILIFIWCKSGCGSWSWFLFDAIQVTKLMWIHVDLDVGPDPQHTAYFMIKEAVVCDFLYEYIPFICKYI